MPRLILLFLLLLVPLPAPAQESGTEGSEEAGPAILSIGSAFFLSGSNHAPAGSEAVFFSPAMIARAGGMDFGFHRYGTTGRLVEVSGATNWWSGTVVFGVGTLTYESGEEGVPADVLNDEGALFAPGPERVSEVVAALGFSRRVWKVQAGVVGKWVQETVGATRAETVALDLGVSRDVRVGRNRNFTLAFAAQNLGRGLRLGGREHALPDRLTASASTGRFGWQAGPLDFGAAIALSRRTDGAYIPAAGVEASYYRVPGRTFFVRLGARRVPSGTAAPVTFGGGFRGDAIRLEYAFQPFDGHGGAHRFAIGFL